MADGPSASDVHLTKIERPLAVGESAKIGLFAYEVLFLLEDLLSEDRGTDRGAAGGFRPGLRIAGSCPVLRHHRGRRERFRF